MLPPTKAPPAEKHEPVVMEDMVKLHNFLSEKEAKPNILTRGEFARFEPLFQKNSGLSRQQIFDLSEDYRRTIDIYKETSIVVSASDTTVLFTLPALFTPVRTLANTERNNAIATANARLFHNNVPRYGAEAFANMILAIRQEQRDNKDVVDAYTQNYVDCIGQFYEKFPNAIPVVNKKEEPYVETGTTTEWDAD